MLKKRICCLILTVCLLVSILPLSAYADAGLTISSEAVELLKREEGFSKKPYWDYAQWTVGYGTKCPDDKLEEYKQNGITEEAAELINKTKKSGHKVLAVGITTIRGLETYVTTNDEVNAYDGWTNKFIFPPYRFAIPTSIVSNFHRPGSTMLMSVAAFGGYENVMKAYKTALEMDYKFGPYGDALLII